MSLTLPEATAELSDDAISILLGPLFAEADRAFRTDPGFVVAIAEASADPEMREAAHRLRGLREAERLRRETALTNAEIAERVGLTVWSVDRHLAQHVPFTSEMRARLSRRQAEEREQEPRTEAQRIAAKVQAQREADALNVRNRRILELRSQGMPCAEIAEHVPLTESGVHHVLKTLGDPLSTKASSHKRAARDQLVRELSDAGLQGKEIARELGISTGRVSQIINRVKR